jgi:hypothetical protein
LVYLSANNSQFLSSTVNKNGEFTFLLDKLLTNNFSSYFNIDNNTVFNIFATDGSLNSTTIVSAAYSDTIPIITLSNNYDFSQKSPSVASKTAELLSNFPSVIPTKKIIRPEILSPKKDQPITDQKPQFQGTGLPNEKVEITIHSTEEIKTQVITNKSGEWTYRPSANLSPGVHAIIIKSRDSSGMLITIEQSFIIHAEEEIVKQSVLITFPPKKVLAATISTLPTLTPTKKPSPATKIATLISTPSPIYIQSSSLANSQSNDQLPPTGSSQIIIIIGGIIAITIGMGLFLLTRTVL